LNIITYLALRLLDLAYSIPSSDDQVKEKEVISFSTPLLNMPEEIWINIFSQLNARDLEMTKLVCPDWSRIANDSLLIPPNVKIAKENVEMLRPILYYCTQCSEGVRCGFWVQLWVDNEGKVAAIDRHDVAIKWLVPKRTDFTGLHAIELRMHVNDWDSEKGEAFVAIPNNARFNPPPALPDHIEIMKDLIINELNLQARGALAITQKENFHDPKYSREPWFSVMLDTEHYKTRHPLINAPNS
jgi:hypothetical protein